MTQALVIPLRLKVMCVGQYDYPDLSESTARFTSLPYLHQDGNDTPAAYLSDGQIYEPFEDSNLENTGIHIHWELPKSLTHGQLFYSFNDIVWQTLSNEGFPATVKGYLQGVLTSNQNLTEQALRQAVQTALQTHQISQVDILLYQNWLLRASAQVDFPKVPNRWLLMRINQSNRNLVRAWVINSDSLYTDQNATGFRSPTIPSPCAPETDGGNYYPHYRYLGHATPYSTWAESSQPSGNNCARVGQWDKLTAIGYGDPTFAAYYPNCGNVFGYYDQMLEEDDYTQVAPGTYTYAVVGWYSEPSDDPLHPGVTAQDVLNSYKWVLSGGGDVSQLSQTLYYGLMQNISWDINKTYGNNTETLTHNDVKVVVGNTPAEALAVYTANTYAQGQQSDISGLTPFEEIAALQIGILDHVQQSPDKASLVKQALHQSAFSSLDGGHIWQVVAKDNTSGGLPASLSSQVATLLNQLNQQQQNYDKLKDQLDTSREQHFADWCLFLSWMHSGDQNDAYTLWDIMDYIQGTLFPGDEQTIGSTWSQLLNTITQLLTALDTNKYELKLIAAPRYWQPTEPSVLLSS
ncbi:MAG: hypothetical protein F6J92_12870, partial [Symploca sp. SIO1A3]|nr:hypothetical protein [Symploca sp. SIO1A3]